MKPIKKLGVKEYMELESKLLEILEQMQNHHIAKAMDGASDMEDFRNTRASELVLRAMKVGIHNGIDRYPNIVYMIEKLQTAIDYLLDYEA